MEKILRYTAPVLLVYFLTILWDLKQQGVITYNIFNTFLQGGKGQGAYYYPVMMQTIFVLPIINEIIVRHKEKGLVICFFINAIYEVLHVAYLIPIESYRLLMFRYIFALAAGCYLATGKPMKKLMVLMFVVGIGFNYSYQYGGYEPVYTIHWTGTCFLAIMYVIPIIGIIIRNCKIKFPPLVYIGKASYNIYLTQMLYYYTGASSVYQSIGNRGIQLLVSLLVCVTSGVLFYIIEKPFTNWLQQKTYARLLT